MALGIKILLVVTHYLSIGIVPINPSTLLSIFRGGVPMGSCEARNVGLLLVLILDCFIF